MLRKIKPPAENLASEIVKEYVSNSTLHGYRYLNEEGRHWIERCIWVVVHLIGAWGVTAIILNTWEQYLKMPTVTTVHSTNYPIWKVTYPSIAICDNNKISRRKILEFAKEINTDDWDWNHKELGRKWIDIFKYLGRLYDHEEVYEENIEILTKLLDYKNISLLEMVAKIAPKCEDILLRCLWNGEERPCSRIFQFRKTMDGFCCTFNFLRDIDKNEKNISKFLNINLEKINKEYVSSIPGFEMGLSVVTAINASDYFYPLEPNIGMKVLIFNPHDFPDKSSGGLNEAYISVGREVFVQLSTSTLLSDNDIRIFPATKRGCWFSDELPAEFSEFYSYSDCIINCRLDSMATLCQCIPFYLPERDGLKICDLRDNICLSKYKEKWFTTKPINSQLSGLEREMEESIECPQCMPTCFDTSYFIDISNSPLYYNPMDKSSKPPEDKDTLENYGVVHIYFDNEYTISYMHSVFYYWYELLGDFGAICGLFVGLSLLSIVEVFYYFIIRFVLKLYIRKCKTRNNMRNKIQQSKYISNSKQWREFLRNELQG